jgi:hypothetical protein
MLKAGVRRRGQVYVQICCDDWLRKVRERVVKKSLHKTAHRVVPISPHVVGDFLEGSTIIALQKSGAATPDILLVGLRVIRNAFEGVKYGQLAVLD